MIMRHLVLECPTATMAPISTATSHSWIARSDISFTPHKRLLETLRLCLMCSWYSVTRLTAAYTASRRHEQKNLMGDGRDILRSVEKSESRTLVGDKKNRVCARPSLHTKAIRTCGRSCEGRCRYSFSTSPLFRTTQSSSAHHAQHQPCSNENWAVTVAHRAAMGSF